MATNIVQVFLECLSSVGEGDIASLVSERNRKISRSIALVQCLFDTDNSRKSVEAILSKIIEDLKSVITEAGSVKGYSDKLWHLFHRYRSEKLLKHWDEIGDMACVEIDKIVVQCTTEELFLRLLSENSSGQKQKSVSQDERVLTVDKTSILS